jgi:hypothetical protein
MVCKTMELPGVKTPVTKRLFSKEPGLHRSGVRPCRPAAPYPLRDAEKGAFA